MHHVTTRCSFLLRLVAVLLLGTGAVSAQTDSRCPLGVYPDGNMFDADSQFAANICIGEGAGCGEVYFYNRGGFSEARCADGVWRRVERRTVPENAPAPRTAPVASAAPAAPAAPAASTEPMALAVAPRCDYASAPAGIVFMNTSRDVCAQSSFSFVCDGGSSAFSNQCGCGCIEIPGQ